MTANSFFVFQSAVTVEGNLDAKPDTTNLETVRGKLETWVKGSGPRWWDTDPNHTFSGLLYTGCNATGTNGCVNFNREGVTGPEKDKGNLFKGSVDVALIIGGSDGGAGLSTFLGDVTTDYIANDNRDRSDREGKELTFRKTLTVAHDIYNNGIIRVQEGDDTPHTAKLILKEGAKFINGHNNTDVANLGSSNDIVKQGVQAHIDQLEVEAGATIDNSSIFEVKNLTPKGEGVTYNQRNAGSLTVESGEWFKNSTINLFAGELNLDGTGSIKTTEKGLGEGNTYNVSGGELTASDLGKDNTIALTGTGKLNTALEAVFEVDKPELQTINTAATAVEEIRNQTSDLYFKYTGKLAEGAKKISVEGDTNEITVTNTKVNQKQMEKFIAAFNSELKTDKGEQVLKFDQDDTVKDEGIFNVELVNALNASGVAEFKEAVYVNESLEGEKKDVIVGSGDGELSTSGFISIKDATKVDVKEGQLTLIGSIDGTEMVLSDAENGTALDTVNVSGGILALGSKGLAETYKGSVQNIEGTKGSVQVDAGEYSAKDVNLADTNLLVDKVAKFEVASLTTSGKSAKDNDVENAGELTVTGETTLGNNAVNTGTWRGQKTTLAEGGVLTHKSGQLNIADLAFVGNGTLKLEDKNFKIDNATWNQGNLVIGNDSGDVISYAVTSTDPINTVMHAKNNGDLGFGENAFSVADSLGAPKVGAGTASRVVLTSQVKTGETGGVVVGTTDTANGLGSLYFAKDSTTLIDVATVGNKGDVSAFTRTAEGGKVTVENGATLIFGNIKDPGKYTITEGYLTNDVVGGWWNDVAHLYALSAEDTGLGWKLVLQHDANTIWIDATPEEATSVYKDLIVPNIADDSLLNCNSGNAGANFICKVLKDPKLDVAGKTRVINSVAQIAFAGGAMATSANDMSTAIDSLEGRLSFKDEVFTPEGYLRDIGFGSNLWIYMIGGKQSYKSLSATGYAKEGFKTDSYGFIAGYDQKLSNKPILLGGAFSVLRGDLKSRSGELLPTTSQYDSYGIYAYGLWTPSPALNLVGNLSYMHNSADIDQTLEGSDFSKAEANVGTRLFAASLRAETHLKYGDFIVIPHIGARYIHAKMSDFATKVDGQTIWNTSSEGVNAFQTPVGVALRSDFQTASGWVVRPHADLTFIPTFGDRDYASTVKNDNAVIDGLSAEFLSKYATSLKVGVQGDYGPSTVGLSYRVIRSNHGGLDQALKLELRRVF